MQNTTGENQGTMSDLSSALALFGFQSNNKRSIERAGIAYECNYILDCRALGKSFGAVLSGVAGGLGISSENSSSNDDLSFDDVQASFDQDEDKYQRYMSKFEPNNWKDQDHYKVLGLSKLRYRATNKQLKMAYRQKVLMYHPDKGKVKGNVRSEAIFGCIQKAYEQLGMGDDKRMSYDSVDPKFDDTIPESSEITKENFFDILAPVFERNSRFSVDQPTPQLGDVNSTRDYVDNFYEFWLHFKSWREFSYNDAEDKFRGEDRRERREIEKFNRIEREQSRKKYLKRVSTLVELAYEKDPRVQMFKEEDKRVKNEEKERRRLEKQRLAEKVEAERLELERQAKDKLRIQQESERAANLEKQRSKKLLQSERRKLRELIKSKAYFTKDADKRLELMEQIERVCMIRSYDDLLVITSTLENVKDFKTALITLSTKTEAEEIAQKSDNFTKNSTSINELNQIKWEPDEIQLLIKATKIYLAGCTERWTQVTKYINAHSKTGNQKPKTEKEVIKEVKRMKSTEATTALTNALQAQVPNAPKVRPKTATSSSVIGNENGSEEWSAAQQKELETALKSIDPKDSQRWEKIAELVSGKTKKQCQQRYKKLVQMVKEGKIAVG